MPKNRKLMLLILASIALAIIGICFFASYLFLLLWPGSANYPIINSLIPVDSGRYKIGQNFSAEESERIINIAFSDPFITGSIWEIGPGHSPDVTSIVRVTADKFLIYTPDQIPEDSIWIPRYKVLPVVIYKERYPNYKGINTYVYVDLDKGYVPYVGYVVRQNIVENWTYSTTGNGVKGTNKYPVPGDTSCFQSDNLSIVYTGYIAPDKLTVLEKDKLVGIALNDSRVKGYLRGYEYKVGKIHSDTLVGLRGMDGYYLAYPCVDFQVLYEGNMMPLMKVVVDLAGSRVTAIRPYNTPPSKNVKHFEIV